MADINLSPYTAEQQAMDRRRKMAEAMQQQAVAPIEMPTVPGAKVSHLQGLAKLLQGYIAGKNLDRADQEQKDYELAINRDWERILNLPSGQQSPVSLTGDVEGTPGKNIPLSLTGKDLGMETGTGRIALLQDLFQQKQQQQAAAQRALEAQQQYYTVAPGASLIQGGKSVFTNPAIPSFEKVETRDPVTGLTIIKYVDKTQLGKLGDVSAPYSGFVKDITEAQNAPESIKNNPALLNVLGSNLNKTGGLSTEKDVVNNQLAEAQARAQLAYQGINLGKTERLVKAKNPLIQSKPLPSAGIQPQIGVVYDTPKGQVFWNGTKFVTID
jgi:hypothetical protein